MACQRRIGHVGEYLRGLALFHHGEHLDDRVHRAAVGHLLKDFGIELLGSQQELEKLESQSKTVVAVAEGDQLIGLIAIADTLKADAKEAVEKLK